jgi:truncated hemoglobin YjbI
MDEVPMIAQKHIRTVVKQLESALQQVADEPLRKLMLERPDFTAKHMRAVNQLKDMDAARDALRKMAYL